MRRTSSRLVRPLRIAALGSAVLMSGCSLLYDSGKLPQQQPDAAIDAPINACALEIFEVAPTVLHEGWGDGGGRPAVLVISGKNFVGSKIELTATDAANASHAAKLEVLDPVVVSNGGGYLVAQLAAHVDETLAARALVELTVSVSQPCPEGGSVTQTKADLVRVLGYDELTANPADGLVTAAPLVYSKVAVTGALTVKAGETGPLILRSNSSLELGAAISVNGGTITAGPGGEAGGPKGAAGGGPGRGNGAPGTGGNGGAAGYVTAGSGALAGPLAGDPLISSYTTNRGSGGGGGVGVLGLIGGDAGGGGGTIELTARGITKLTNLTAIGGGGTQGNGSAGAGGSGGTIVLRGSEVTAGTLNVSGGPSMGNPGAAGRIRIDTPTLVSATSVPAGGVRRGGTFPKGLPWVVTEDKIAISLLGTTGTKLDLRVLDSERQAQGAPVTVDFQASDEVTARVPLQLGYNLVCALPQGSSVSVAESTNCVEIARLAP
jgi:hypothetical protein